MDENKKLDTSVEGRERGVGREMGVDKLSGMEPRWDEAGANRELWLMDGIETDNNNNQFHLCRAYITVLLATLGSRLNLHSLCVIV
jgi:hypothetical protein